MILGALTPGVYELTRNSYETAGRQPKAPSLDRVKLLSGLDDDLRFVPWIPSDMH